jgi:hypothetical protein
MHITRWAVLLVVPLALALVSKPCSAQKPSSAPTAQTVIWLSGAKLTLAMPLESATDQLSQCCDVKKSSEKGDFSSWIVSEKGSGGRGEFRGLGSLAFRNGKLESVFKEWERDQSQVEMAKAFYGAISSFVKEGLTDCTLSAGQKDTPESESKAAFLTCGRKYIRIDILKSKYGETASVVEVLEVPKIPK